MANMGAYKPKNAYQYNNTNYDDKSSDHGHYVPEITGKRYGQDGSMAPVTQMRWVEDNRSFEAPDAEPEQAPMPEVVDGPQYDEPTSQQVSDAQELADSYKANILSGSNSPYNTMINSSPPNLNSPNQFQTSTADVNVLGDNSFMSSPTSDDAASSFLQKKKLELGSGLNLQ